ncbi:MAG: hypothetical protein J3K34DRAFT_385246 [Monoraphidium minutum]|nr:MAG: hypothetical protein J3K34DRAFT_385246 [Monoraphidium minutum]
MSGAAPGLPPALLRREPGAAAPAAPAAPPPAAAAAAPQAAGPAAAEGEEEGERPEDAVLFEPSVTAGGRAYGPSHGLYPRGCRWRDVGHTNGSDEVTYQYWDHAAHVWTDRRPAACTLQGAAKPGPPGWRFLNGSPRTEVEVFKTHVVYKNLWYNAGRWYALVDGPKHVASWRFSRNQEISALHVKDAAAFAASVDWRLQAGDTLLFDYIFFTHPTAIGHWWEMVAPLFSVLKRIDFKRPADSFVLLHLQRRHLPEWVRAMLAVALGVGPARPLPPIYLQEPADISFAQMTKPLEGVPPTEWLVFERVLIIRDIFTGGSRTFASKGDAHEFRAAVYGHYGLPRPAKPDVIPATVTFQRKRANRRVLNEDALLKLLGSYGDVRVVEFDATSSLKEQLLTMAGTGLFVSVHTSNLANAPLLQPGSAVLEFIPRHWTWMNLDRSFKDQTARMGDIHHWAWRATKRNESVYLNPRDEARFAHWSRTACQTSEDCIEAQTSSDLRVDLRAVKALLAGRMPLVAARKGVKAAELPWPPDDS